MVPIGHQIYKKRLERGMTQAELAQKAGIPQPNLSNIEKGRQDITISTLRRIAYGLGVEIADFFQKAVRIKNKRYLSLSRSFLERMACAIATNEKANLSRKEQRVARLFQGLIPELRKGRLKFKKMNQNWLELKMELDPSAIGSVVNRVREVRARQR